MHRFLKCDVSFPLSYRHFDLVWDSHVGLNSKISGLVLQSYISFDVVCTCVLIMQVVVAGETPINMTRIRALDMQHKN